MQQLRILSLLGLFIVSLSPNLKAQSDWLDGFIIELDGDTIKGKVGYQTSDLQFSKCIFKQGNSIRQFSPEQIKGYGINDIKSYSSGVVEAQFAEVIAIGPLSLFKQRKILFVRTESGEVFPLASKTRIVREDGNDYVSEGKRWKSILYGILSSCDISSDLIKDLSFNDKNVLDLIKRYNSCKNQNTKTYSNKPFQKTLVDLGLQVGIRNNEFNVSSSDGVSRPLDTSHESSNLIVGAFANFRFPNFSEKLSFQIGLNYQSLDLLGVSSFSNANNPFRTSLIIDRYDISSSFTTLGIPVSLKGLLVDKAISVYFQTGLTFNQVFQASSEIMRTRTIDNGSPAISEVEGGLDFQNGSEFWGLIGISRSIKGKFKIGLEFNFSILPNDNIVLNNQKVTPYKHSSFSISISY